MKIIRARATGHAVAVAATLDADPVALVRMMAVKALGKLGPEALRQHTEAL